MNDLDQAFMRRALELARRAYGHVSPNPLVGAVLVKAGRVIGEGYHHRAGLPHAEIEAIRAAEKAGHRTKGATLYVTLEPCCSHGRTPPCTNAILASGVARVVVAAIDPNPRHRGRGLKLLRRRGVRVESGVLQPEATQMNEAFNHWVVKREPFVVVKSAMTLDGKIATASGESRWITGPAARAKGMWLRQGADAILVGIRTVIADDPSLTIRREQGCGFRRPKSPLKRVVLDSLARTPLTAKLVRDSHAADTIVVVAESAPRRRVRALSERVTVWQAPSADGRIDLSWLLAQLGQGGITQLLVEGGGEVNAAFLQARRVQRVAFFYAPKILGGRDAKRAVAGTGFPSLDEAPRLSVLQWERIGADLFLTGLVS